jgi:hypothetical protein
LLIVPTPTDKTIQKRESLINIKKIDMKKISFIFGLVALLSVVLVSCSADYSDGPMQAPQKKVEPTPDPTPKPNDSTEWKNYAGTTHKVYPESYVIAKIYALNHKGESDSLVNRYPFVRSLKNDTTLYLSKAPETGLGYTGSTPDQVWLGEFSHNAQNDSCAVVYGRKGYKLSNGVTLTLNTERQTIYHMIDGTPRKYSEPTQKFGTMTIDSVKTEFERNDSIYCLRTNSCKTYTKLGDQTFVDSCTVREVWFIKLKETPEPSFDYKVDGLLKFVCGSKVKNEIGWADGIMFEGSQNLYFVIDSYSKDGKLMGREIHTTPKNRVVYNNQVNGIVFDSTTGLYAPALIVSDKEGWSCEGFVDGRSVTCDRSNTHAIDEGIKNFVDKSTSVPSVFFASTPTASVKEWHGKKYITVTWSKYSEDTKLVNRQVTVAEK